jgi:hypothetical protein
MDYTGRPVKRIKSSGSLVIPDPLPLKELTVTALPTQVVDTLAWQWEDVGTAGVEHLYPNTITFTYMTLQRCVSSRGFFVPAHLDVGGWIKFEHPVTGTASTPDLMYGVHFKDASTVYEMQDVGFGESEFYHWLNGTTGTNNLMMQNGVVETLGTTPTHVHADGETVSTRVTRTSADLWTIDFTAGVTQITETCSFGSEYAYKHCHEYMGILSTDTGKSATITSTTVTYAQWNPTSVNCALHQDAQNALVCTNEGGDELFHVSDSDCIISQPLVTAHSIGTHAALFGYQCPVQTVFYSSVVGGVYAGGGPASRELHIGESGYGSPFIPRLRPGNIYEVSIDGLLKCSAHNTTTCYIEVFIGVVKVASCAVGDKLGTETFKALPFSINFKIVVPQIQFVRFPATTVRTIGLFKYHNWSFNNSHGISGFGIQDYQLNTQVPIDSPGELRVVASWVNSTGAGDTIEMLSTKYSCTGFNT